MMTFQELKEYYALPREVLQEKEYRRGYADGFIQAVIAMENLTEDKRFSIRKCLIKADTFWDLILCEWRNKRDWETHPPPPDAFNWIAGKLLDERQRDKEDRRKYGPFKERS